jgi:hypothetical protein
VRLSVVSCVESFTAATLTIEKGRWDERCRHQPRRSKGQVIYESSSLSDAISLPEDNEMMMLAIIIVSRLMAKFCALETVASGEDFDMQQQARKISKSSSRLALIFPGPAAEFAYTRNSGTC